MSATILVVEDEQIVAEVLRDYLKQDGFDAVCLHDGREVVPWVRENKPQLVVLDLMLPGRSGLEICKEIRGFCSIPIIMVTARVEEVDRLLGLELGADDYICKPFSPREVVARVKAVLRRSDAGVNLQAGELVLDEPSYRASVDGRDLGLTAIEFRLLMHLASNPTRIYSREQLLSRIYRDERSVTDRTIDTLIKNLRKKLGAAAPGISFIQSVYGVGYKFEQLPLE